MIEHAKSVKADRVQLTMAPMIYQSKYSNYLDFALVRNGFQYLKRKYQVLFSWILNLISY
jgi:hypothetical protein